MPCRKLGELSEKIGGQIIGDPGIEIRGVSGIKEAQKYDISFLANPKYRHYLNTTAASAVIVSPEIEEGKMSLVQVQNPYFAFLQVVKFFFPQQFLVDHGIHPSAVIGRNVDLAPNVTIEANVVVQDNVTIGEGSIIRAGTFIGHDSHIGTECVIHPNVTLYHHVTLENRVIIHAGTVVGSDGFGYAFKDGAHHKVPQIGTVVIEDDVEIGANVTIDRAALGKTHIKRGTKIDNLVQIGHNVLIGEHSIIVSQVGISGSTEIGRGVVVGGQAGLAGHIQVGDGAQIGAQSGVTKSLPDGAKVSGYPARPHGQAKRKEASILRLPKLFKRVLNLEKSVSEIKDHLSGHNSDNGSQ